MVGGDVAVDDAAEAELVDEPDLELWGVPRVERHFGAGVLQACAGEGA